jgi:hypothetical protein
LMPASGPAFDHPLLLISSLADLVPPTVQAQPRLI